MASIAKDSELHRQMRAWRKDIHAHPETAYEEHRTAAKVAKLLQSFDLEVHTGLAVTGVVATLQGNKPGKGCIGLRADLDALKMQELNNFAHCSRHDGKMHACGHDCHTAMLLGAAKYLSQNRDFAGTVVFIFQPAEEGEAGAKMMCEQGLFEQFNVDAVYGMHNWPGIEQGKFAVHTGPVMASMDLFDITISGQGCHAGMPHLGTDPIMVAGQLIGALQSIVSRDLDPLHSGVVSITQIHAGEAYNVIPDSVTLSGTCRAFSVEQQQQIETLMGQRVASICEAFGAKGELDYRRVAPCTENHPQHTQICRLVTTALVGEENVILDQAPSMGSEDFAFMLLEKPGAYIWIGNGTMQGGKGLHNPHYDFNDEVLALGASYWVALTQQQLA
ncbi:MAG: M20 family metallopeptidase [Pseudomonadales bacterium]|nr:M20 family metallopeptidase [Pseudomonadales bacterium]